jgi:site-specific DNA recombinase
VIALLTGDAILGRITHRGAPMRDADGNALAPFPAVIDLTTARAVRAALNPKRDGPRHYGGNLPSRLLSGLIRCHSCRRPLIAVNTTGKYQCGSRSMGFTCAQPVSVAAVRAEKTVEAALLAKSGEARWNEIRVLAADDGALAAVDDRHAAVLAQLGKAPTAVLFAALQELTAQREELASRPRKTTVVLVDTGRTVADEWERRDLADRRELLADSLESLVLLGAGGRRTYDPARLLIAWQPSVTEDEATAGVDVILPAGVAIGDALRIAERPARLGPARAAD